jgi:hypothetical protein
MLSKAVENAQKQGYATANDIAVRSGVHRTTVALAIRQGKLKSRKVGNVFLVSSRDAAAFIAKYRLTE